MEFDVGDKVYVKRIGADWTLSEILYLREKDGEDTEYFVHYEGFNRRLDEWIPKSRIMSIDCYENQQGSYNGMLNNHDGNLSRKMTRHQKRKFDEMYHVQKSFAEMDPTTAALEKEHAERTKIKYIKTVILGMNEIDTWYYSPYPREYEKVSKIFVCELCLKYMAHEQTYRLHITNCAQRIPPGVPIYSHDGIVVHEVDGAINKLYCQNLCLLGKLFLDHKTLYFDVSPFYFYVAFQVDNDGYHITSYFSKEKESADNYNVACILTFPPYQRVGLGKFLISLSYELSKAEGKVGTPEKPLSDLGHLSYRSYWSYVILDYLRTKGHSVLTINDLSVGTGISKNDLIETLQVLNLLKYWKGNYVACFNPKIIDDHIKSGYCRAPRMIAEPKYLNIEFLNERKLSSV